MFYGQSIYLIERYALDIAKVLAQGDDIEKLYFDEYDFKDAKNKPKGLTTASTIWCTASIGIAVGLNMFIIAIVGTILLFFILELSHYKWYIKWKQSIKNKE